MLCGEEGGREARGAAADHSDVDRQGVRLGCCVDTQSMAACGLEADCWPAVPGSQRLQAEHDFCLRVGLQPAGMPSTAT